EKYQPQKVDLAGGEQRTEGYLKINPQGRVPALKLDDGEPLAENTAILPYLGKRFGLWPSDAVAEAKALSLIGFFAASVHPAHAHVGRPERYAADPSAFPTPKETGPKTFHNYLKQIDGKLAGRRRRGLFIKCIVSRAQRSIRGSALRAARGQAPWCAADPGPLRTELLAVPVDQRRTAPLRGVYPRAARSADPGTLHRIRDTWLKLTPMVLGPRFAFSGSRAAPGAPLPAACAGGNNPFQSLRQSLLRRRPMKPSL